MTIRIARPSDYQAIAALHAASWRFAYRGALSEAYLADDIVADRENLWKRRLSDPASNQYVVVTEVDGALAGFACAYLRDDPFWALIVQLQSPAIQSIENDGEFCRLEKSVGYGAGSGSS